MASVLPALLSIVAPPNNCPIIPKSAYPGCACSGADYASGRYDFVIVGGGTAGCVLANRLTEDPSIRVLLVEVGDHPSWLTEIPLDFLFLQKTDEDWAFEALQDDFFKAFVDRTNNWPQGRVLGGSSSINAMIYAPGVPYDYDYWAQLTGDPIWSWSTMQRYFRKLQRNVRTTTYAALARPARSMLELGARQLNIPVNDAGTMFGYKDHATTIYEHTRFSMAKAYLRPIGDRRNLCVVVGRAVSRIVIEDATAVGVEVQDPHLGPVVIRATKEVLLTAGAINSPKLLMLSGIGPARHLASLGLPLRADLPVGQHLEDHLIVPLFATVPDVAMPAYEALLAAYCLTGAVLGDIGVLNFIGFFNTRGDGDASRPDVEMLHKVFLADDPTFLPTFIDRFGYADDIARQLRAANREHPLLLFVPTLLHPLSRGAVHLRDAHYATKPLIRPNYLARREDVEVLTAAVNQFVLPMLGTLPFAANLSRLVRFDLPECDRLRYLSDGYWRCYFAHFAGTVYHAAGTCRMGREDAVSVVDSRLRVWGIGNLRVADSSTIPALISGHNNVPTCALAEHAADIVKQDHNIIISP